ncbi:MAG: hypothetical protein J6S69_00975 [Proteobacteria bacterium]|nr:hypothetical protein [Pseudomonadota bacterium]
MKNLIHLDEISVLVSPFAAQAGYSEQMLCWGFERLAEQWHEAGILAFCRQELPELSDEQALMLMSADLELEKRCEILKTAGIGLRTKAEDGQKLPSVMLVSASTVPSASFQDVILMLMLPVHVVQRPSSNLAPLFEALHGYVERHAPLLAQRWTVLPASHDDDWMMAQLAKHDWINICGSDSTIAHYQSLLDRLDNALKPVLIPHGHRLSCVVLTAEDIREMTETEWTNLALDVSVWDQTGCLSPKCLFVENPAAGDMDRIVGKLLPALDLVASALPEIPPSLSEMAAKNSALRMTQLDGADVYRANVNHDAVIVWPADTPFTPVLLPRTLNVYAVSQLSDGICRLAPHGQALGTRKSLSFNIQNMAQASGFNFFCILGQMQNPPLSWLHDGVGTYAGMVCRKNLT